MNTINFKDFSILELNNILEDISIINKKDFNSTDRFTISDHLEFSFSSGSENIYLDIIIYPYNLYKAKTLRLFTKDNHIGLKTLINHILGNIKYFPNGFKSWQETYFEVVSEIINRTIFSGSVSNIRLEEQGTGGLYELAEELTDIFEKENKGVIWGEDKNSEYFDLLESFLKNNL